MMRQRAVWSCNLVVLLVGVGMYAVFGFLPQFVQTPRAAGYGFGVGLSQAGLILLPSAIATFIVGVAAGRLTRAFGTRVLMMFGCSCCATSAWLIAFSHTQLWTLYLSQAFMGAGFGLAFATVSSVIVAAVPMNQTGVASGMSANIRTIGGAVGTASMATVLVSTYRSDGLPSEAGYTFGFAMLGTALAVGAVVAYFTPRGRPSQEALVLERAA
jgi:MFS family permease